MKIIVISDTHGNLTAMQRIVSDNRSADLFIHLGDGEREYEDVREKHPEQAFLIVRGNNDWGGYPISTAVSLEGHRLYLTHGSQYPRDALTARLSGSARLSGCDIALFGHTHVPFCDTVDGVRLFNPGSPSLPRGRSKPSYGVILLKEGEPPELWHEEYTGGGDFF